MTKSTTDQWAEEIGQSMRGSPYREALTELVRLRRELEEFLGELNDDLAHEEIENYEDISDAWPSMQEYGELAVKLAHRNILSRILEGHK